MATIIMYSLLSSVTLILVYILYKKNIKEPNKYRSLFLAGIFMMQIAQLIYLIGTIIYLNQNSSNVLYITDIIGRFIMILSSAVFIRIPILALFPKNKNMKKISYIFILWSIIFIFVNMSFNYYPAINSNGIIIWDTPPLLNIIYSIAQFLPLVLIIGISLITYINSKLEYTKPLLLFIGFMAILVGGVFQEYAIEPMAFYIVNFTIFFGFITVLLAQFSKDEK